MRHALVIGLAAAAAALVPWSQAAAQKPDPTAAEFDKFREIMEQDNPAELFEVKGDHDACIAHDDFAPTLVRACLSVAARANLYDAAAGR